MTQYNALKVKLSNLKISKLKPRIINVNSSHFKSLNFK